RVSELSDDEKPRVYFEYHRDYATSSASSYMDCVVFAGANNIFGDLPPSTGRGANVDPEAVIVRDPEIIVTCRGAVCNYDVDDPSEAEALRGKIMGRPGFDRITAVTEDEVYLLPASFFPIYGGAPCHWFIGIAYMAKLFNPELFEDLDPEAMHQEYLTEFQRIDYSVYEQGVFVYPPFEES
ncbi:MAG: ABC transporter substrate-binding protein, partial [Euryarchaeota archaeon]|nr:ABC transporter substrate-binding protein [Euryarchaeota archaeon]